MAQLIKNMPAMWKTWVRSLGWEDPLEEGTATHSSILAWSIPKDRGAWWATSPWVAKSWTWLSDLSTAQDGICCVSHLWKTDGIWLGDLWC